MNQIHDRDVHINGVVGDVLTTRNENVNEM